MLLRRAKYNASKAPKGTASSTGITVHRVTASMVGGL
jgi:hypothetical protein